MTKQELAAYRRRRTRIKRLLADGLSQAEVGRILGIKRQRVNQIVRGK